MSPHGLRVPVDSDQHAKEQPVKRLANPIEKVNAHVLGLDVHKESIVWVLLDRKGAAKAEGTIGADPDSLRRLVRTQIGRKKAHAAFESSGFSYWVRDVLLDLLPEEHVHAAHARHVKSIANSKQKNDINDAFWLAYLTHEGRLPEAWLPKGLIRELRLATRERMRYVQQRTRSMNEIHAHLNQAGKGRLLRRGALSTQIGRDMVRELLEEIIGVAATAIRYAIAQIELGDELIAEWEQVIETLSAQLPDTQMLKNELPGVGPILAATIVAEIGSIERFHNPKALACYAGLTPTDRSSAGVNRGSGITKEGSRALRWALVQAVVACGKCKRGPGVNVAHWVRLRQKRMNSKKKGQVAGARKMAECIWRLLNDPDNFNARRPFGRVPLRVLQHGLSAA